MKAYYILLIILFSFSAYAQNKSSVTELVSHLSWKSVTINSDDVLLYADTISNELVDIGTPAAKELVNALKTPEKTVAAHIILSRIYDPYVDLKGFATFYLDCPQATGLYYVFPGIYWFELEGKYRITEAMIDVVYSYWYSEIILQKKATLPSFKELTEFTRKAIDDLTPCNSK